MTIDQIRVKEKDALTADEKTFLDEHKTELSKVELVKFGYEKEEQEELSAEDRALLTPENKETLAAIAAGKKVLVDAAEQTGDKDRLDRMEGQITKYRENDAKAILDSHVKRGAIRSDQAELTGFWGKQLLSADETVQQGAVDALDALPTNEQLTKELGSGAEVVGNTAREQLHNIALKKVEDSKKDGATALSYPDALKEAARENGDLQKQDLKEQNIA